MTRYFYNLVIPPLVEELEAVIRRILPDVYLSNGAKLLYLHLYVNYRKFSPVTFPNQATLADDLNVSLPTIGRWEGKLLRRGLLERWKEATDAQHP